MEVYIVLSSIFREVCCAMQDKTWLMWLLHHGPILKPGTLCKLITEELKLGTRFHRIYGCGMIHVHHMWSYVCCPLDLYEAWKSKPRREKKSPKHMITTEGDLHLYFYQLRTSVIWILAERTERTERTLWKSGWRCICPDLPQGCCQKTCSKLCYVF